MVNYDKEKLDKNKYGILGIYIGDLRTLQSGDVPSLFETRSEWLQEALPYFPEDERKKYQEVLNVGLQQFRFVRAAHVFNSLSEGEEYRKTTLDGFLNSFE